MIYVPSLSLSFCEAVNCVCTTVGAPVDILMVSSLLVCDGNLSGSVTAANAIGEVLYHITIVTIACYHVV